MMTLSDYFSREFESKVRSRGDGYVARGAVRALTIGKDGFFGRVQGSDLYRVRFHLNEGGSICDCTCPHTDHWGTPCKHVWALIRAAEKLPDTMPLIRKVV